MQQEIPKPVSLHLGEPLRGLPLIGLAATPVAAALATFILYPLYLPHISIGGRIFVAVFTGVLAALIVIVGAGPVFVWWRRRHELTLSSVLLWGGLFGNVPTLIMALILVVRAFAGYPPRTLRAVALPLSLGTAVGLTCATVFWLIAVRPAKTRENRDAPSLRSR